MGLTLDTVRSSTLGGACRQKIIDITFDSAYASGGEPLTPATLGMRHIDAVVFENKSGYVLDYDRTNEVVHAYRSDGVAGSAQAVEFQSVAGQDETSDATITVSGVAATDNVVAVLFVSTAASVATIEDVTANFSVTAANELTSAVPVDRTNDQLLIFTQADPTADADAALAEVAAGVNLSSLRVRAVVYGL